MVTRFHSFLKQAAGNYSSPAAGDIGEANILIPIREAGVN
jgi:hypothetical protein